jgi:hypothetical protein
MHEIDQFIQILIILDISTIVSSSDKLSIRYNCKLINKFIIYRHLYSAMQKCLLIATNQLQFHMNLYGNLDILNNNKHEYDGN